MSPRHGVGRLLNIMQGRGSITPAMRQAGLKLHQVLTIGGIFAREIPASLGPPAGECLREVIGRGRPLREWARLGWLGRPISQEAAAGILIAALGALAHGAGRLLLDKALARAAVIGIAAGPLALPDPRLPAPGQDCRPHRNATAPGEPIAGGSLGQPALAVRAA